MIATRTPERAVLHLGNPLHIVSMPWLELLRREDAFHVRNELLLLVRLDLPQLLPTSTTGLETRVKQGFDLLSLFGR